MGKIEKLYMLRCGAMPYPDSLIACAPNTTREYKRVMNICFYILEHPTEGLILLDTGTSVDTATEELIAELAFLQPNVKKQLPKIGKSCEDVKHVVLSHLHADHFGQTLFFPNATVHVRKKDWDAVHEHLKCFHALDWEFTAELEKTFPPERIDLLPDDPEIDLFGDGSVICIDTKGHTPGHQSFLVHLKSGMEMLFTMDAAHCADEMYDERYLLPAQWDFDKSREAYTYFKDYIRRTGNPVYILHDLYQWYDMKHFPEYYE